MTTNPTAGRRLVLASSGLLGLAAAVVAIVGLAWPPSPAGNPVPSFDRLPGAPPAPLPPPPPYTGPLPPSPFTPQEQAILRNLVQGGQEPPTSAMERDRLAQAEQEFDEAGGNSPAAFPFYLRLLNWESPINWRKEQAILNQVARIPCDRSEFRKPSVDRLKHRQKQVVESAVLLLKEIGTPTEAAEVAKLIQNYEFDHPGERLDHGPAHTILLTLAAIGTEAEIKALEQAKANHFLWDNDKFWAKAEACKKAIRERLAKENEKTDKK